VKKSRKFLISGGALHVMIFEWGSMVGGKRRGDVRLRRLTVKDYVHTMEQGASSGVEDAKVQKKAKKTRVRK